jgi:mevalonate kinase
MQQATQLALTSFSDKDSTLLKQAIDEAHGCYKDWGLVNGSLKQHIAELQAHGAVAVKPTGSGGEGGHVLSLWDGPIPVELKDVLKPVF